MNAYEALHEANGEVPNSCRADQMNVSEQARTQQPLQTEAKVDCHTDPIPSAVVQPCLGAPKSLSERSGLLLASEAERTRVAVFPSEEPDKSLWQRILDVILFWL